MEGTPALPASPTGPSLSSDGTLSWTAPVGTCAAAGNKQMTWDVTFRVRDDSGLSDSKSVRVTLKRK